MIRCLVKAWEQATSSMTGTVSPNDDPTGSEIPGSLLQVLHLAERALENENAAQTPINPSEASLIIA